MSRILVVGGSLGGLLAANILLRDGHDVHILEKTSNSLDGRGAGIVTHPPLMRALARAGVVVDDTIGIRVESRVALDAQGETVARLPMPQIVTSWSRLYTLLLEAFPAERHHAGVTVDAVVERDDVVHVSCGSGAAFDGDVVIASDGVRSAVRAQYLPDAVPLYAGYVAWRGVCDEALLSKETLDTVFDHFAFGMPEGEQLVGYPVAGPGNATARGQRRFNFVWYREASEAVGLRALMTDADERHYPLGIPPHRIASSHVVNMRVAGRRLLAPQFVEILEKCAQPFLQPIYDVASSRLAFGRVALMGDAAFVARPHVGMGVTKAAEDAMALGDAIGALGATPEALLAFEANRLVAGQAAVERGRKLGAYMQSQGSAAGVEILRDAQMVLRETGIDLSQLDRPIRDLAALPLAAA